MNTKGKRTLKKEVKVILALLIIVVLGVGFTYLPFLVRLNGSSNVVIGYGSSYEDEGL